MNDRMRQWFDAAAAYGKPRVLAVFFLGIASGFPLTLALNSLSFWLSQEGISKGQIGLFSALLTPYMFKFLWSPLVDRLHIPVLSRLVGQRRAWLFLSQVCLVAAILGLAGTNPHTALGSMALFAFFVALASATQDIVIDAYRIEILKDSEQGHGAAMINFGYRTGNLVMGAGGLLLADTMGWPDTFRIMAALVLFGTLAAIWIGEPQRHDETEADEREAEAEAFIERNAHLPHAAASAAGWIYGAVVAPFVEFLSRHGAVLILLFVIIFKMGDAMASVMTPPFLVDLGFTNAEIVWANKVVAFATLMVGTALGGVMTYKMGMFRALLVTGVLMMVSNLLFAALAVIGHDVGMLAVTIGFENFATGMGLSVFVAYLSGLCNLAYTATQYALLSSLAVVGRTWLAAPSGFIQEAVGWAPFFVITTVAALPGLALLLVLWRKGFQVTAPAPAAAVEKTG